MEEWQTGVDMRKLFNMQHNQLIKVMLFADN